MGTGSTTFITHLADNLFFGGVPDDILVNILCRLDDDPRDLARLACVSTRFCNLIKTVCWKLRCEKTLPLLVAELLQSPSPALHPFSEPPGGWSALQKLHVCCPGLWHAGVLLENWDFGLNREIGWYDGFSYTDGVSHCEGVFPALGRSHICKSLGKKCRNRYVGLGVMTSPPSSAECSTNGSDGRITCFDVDYGVAHNPGDVCGLLGAHTHNFGSEVGVHSDGSEAGMHSDGIEVGIDQGECEKKCSTVRHKHCPGLEVTVSKIIDGGAIHVSKSMRDDEFQEGAIEPLDDSHGLEASGVDCTGVADKQGTQQICKSACTESLSVLLKSDASNHVSLETSCGQQHKEVLDSDDAQMNRINLASSDATTHVRRESNKRQRECCHEDCHFATGPWNLSREQGNKLLANRFRADSLYICDWPGCVHPGDKRMYKLFRGVFKNFKNSHVWRNLRDMQAKATNVGCAFCVCKSTWDMVTTFCLKRSIVYHDDGEPVVRAYVCENGHVAGAWTDRPMHTF
eukprot:c21814_g1_i1 orf=488-2032(+)